LRRAREREQGPGGRSRQRFQAHLGSHDSPIRKISETFRVPRRCFASVYGRSAATAPSAETQRAAEEQRAAETTGRFGQ
jgi:hypothetical protein